jgi:KUP system potassium uptake protein
MTIVHTSAEEIGQVYVAEVNWLLMLATIGLVLGFGSSGSLAAAYGVAVTTTMVISTVLFYVLARERWGWSRLAAGLPVGLFLAVDLAFFGANMTKIAHGAWFPLVVAAAVFVLMTTWKRGRYLLLRRFRSRALTLEDFLEKLPSQGIPRVDGTAVFLNSDARSVPAALLHNLRHNRVLHERVVVLTVVHEQVPRVPRTRKLELEELSQGFMRLVAHFGFMEEASVGRIFALAREQDLELEPRQVSYFLGRERVLPSKRPGMALWRDRLFAALSRNALSATAYYGIPPDRVVELGSQVEI